jgi:hypothetical protein
MSSLNQRGTAIDNDVFAWLLFQFGDFFHHVFSNDGGFFPGSGRERSRDHIFVHLVEDRPRAITGRLYYTQHTSDLGREAVKCIPPSRERDSRTSEHVAESASWRHVLRNAGLGGALLVHTLVALRA